MADYIFDNPELETAFRATYESGYGRPSIRLLCEYDALEGMGHACAHHMQGPSMVEDQLILFLKLHKVHSVYVLIVDLTLMKLQKDLKMWLRVLR